MLLDVDPGQSTNRTVYTFVGDPESIVNAALNAAKAAFSLINMAKHTGEHPRFVNMFPSTKHWILIYEYNPNRLLGWELLMFVRSFLSEVSQWKSVLKCPKSLHQVLLKVT